LIGALERCREGKKREERRRGKKEEEGRKKKREERRRGKREVDKIFCAIVGILLAGGFFASLEDVQFQWGDRPAHLHV
jgi:hypothetical protein